MSEVLCSVGLDVGTTSTQLIFSRLRVENRAGSFAVPELSITDREVLYRGDVHFTPLIRGELVDGAAIRRIVEGEYTKAGISREDVDTGAIIITGETSRKENAAAVLEELSGFAGNFVVATAGPGLESVLAARGAGADSYSRRTGKTVLHMDIGGGTSNLALIRDGEIIATGCVNVGGRLLKLDDRGTVTYVSPVLAGLCDLHPGDSVTEEALQSVVGILTQTLEMAAGFRARTDLLEKLWTRESDTREAFCTACRDVEVISFSGGVADCILSDKPWLTYGDLGPTLGRAIRASRLCAGDYVLGEETIRATVIGAGCHSTTLSGSTVFHRNISFPLKNLPVLSPEAGESGILVQQAEIRDYHQLRQTGEAILRQIPEGPVLVCMEQDMAKALGQVLALLTTPERPILCIDRVKLKPGSYLDVGAPVGTALPVVIKTLVLGK